MPEITEALVRERLSTVKYPGFSRDIISFGLVKSISIAGGDVGVQMTLATNDPKVPQAIKEGAEAALAQLPGIGKYFINGALQRDYTLVMGVVILYASLVIALNLVADVLYGLLDPKVRYE